MNRKFGALLDELLQLPQKYAFFWIYVKSSLSICRLELSNLAMSKIQRNYIRWHDTMHTGPEISKEIGLDTYSSK